MQPVAEMPFVAGHAALDFANTAEQRGHPDAGDALATVADLRLWGQRYGLITRSAALDEEAEGEFDQAVEARELLYRLFCARAHHQALPKAEVAGLGELAGSAYFEATLQPAHDGSIRWRWNPSRLSTIRHVAVTSAIDLLHAEPSSRLKQCPGEHCGWFFLDATKRGNRRWCSMSDCGQDAKNLSRRKTTSPRR